MKIYLYFFLKKNKIKKKLSLRVFKEKLAFVFWSLNDILICPNVKGSSKATAALSHTFKTKPQHRKWQKAQVLTHISDWKFVSLWLKAGKWGNEWIAALRFNCFFMIQQSCRKMRRGKKERGKKKSPIRVFSLCAADSRVQGWLSFSASCSAPEGDTGLDPCYPPSLLLNLAEKTLGLKKEQRRASFNQRTRKRIPVERINLL